MKKLTLLAIICQIASLTLAQVSTLSNTFFAPTDYIGWDATPGSPPLHIKTELNQPIRFYTNAGAGSLNNLRMTIFSGATQTRGEVAIHLNPTAPITSPVSMLHIGQASGSGSRTWMEVGTTYTEELDLMYVGIKNVI